VRKKARARLGVLLLAALLATAGCSFTPDKTQTNDKAGNKAQKSDKFNVVLYFSDKDAMNLVPENREIEVKDKHNTELLAQAIVEGLIKGPRSSKLVKTIPPEARVLSVKIDNGIAKVDFSEEISTKHWGGSTGETMTVSSIVDSLTELEGINMVQILIAGKQAETLAGHLDISQPLARNKDIIKK
jgi:spore germination protein GerM